MAGPISTARAARETQRAPQRGASEDLDFLDEESEGPFAVDLSKKPDGMSYAWRRITYAGKEDVRHQARMHRNRWTPVPKKRHPEIVGHEASKNDPEGAIVIDGQMLMERPAPITEEAERRDVARAKGRVRDQMRTLRMTPEGQLPRKLAVAKKQHNIQVAEPDETAGDGE